MRIRQRLGLVVVAIALMTGCAGMRDETMMGRSDGMMKSSLYERLGGLPAIRAVVEELVANVAADSRINGRFANADVTRLKLMLVDQVCAATGGPCTYRGRDMKTAHAGMRITDAEFAALVEDLVMSLDKFKVPAQEKSELLSALGGLRSQIVGQ